LIFTIIDRNRSDDPLTENHSILVDGPGTLSYTPGSETFTVSVSSGEKVDKDTLFVIVNDLTGYSDTTVVPITFRD